MLFKSEHITQASGSVGGVTYSRNRGGLYRRARAVPVDPNTFLQQVTRQAVAGLVERWGAVLTEAQRDGWRTYAAETPLTGPLGDPRDVGGLGMYVRGNVARVQAELEPVDEPPTVFTLASTLTWGPTTQMLEIDAFDAGNNTIDILVRDTALANAQLLDPDAAGSAFLFYVGRPRNVGRQFFKGPWRLLGKLANDGTAYVFPLTQQFTSPYAFGPGNRVTVGAVLTTAGPQNGRGRYGTRSTSEFVVPLP